MPSNDKQVDNALSTAALPYYEQNRPTVGNLIGNIQASIASFRDFGRAPDLRHEQDPWNEAYIRIGLVFDRAYLARASASVSGA